MEHIGKVLQDLSTGIDTRSRPTTHTLEPDHQKKTKLEQLRVSLGVSNLENTFCNFERVPGSELALSAFKAIVTGELPTRHMLLCYGGVGNGKTYLCEATAIALYKRGEFCRVFPFESVLSALKEAMNSGVNRYTAILQRFSYASRLIIDDVGAGTSGKEFADTILEAIVIARYRERLLTVVTTNKDLSELSDRVVSRFQDKAQSYLVLNSAPDFRGTRC